MGDIFDEIRKELEEQIFAKDTVLPNEFDEFYPNKADEKSAFINSFVTI